MNLSDQTASLEQSKALAYNLIAEIDQLISAQLSKVMSDKKFQALEARWLNLQELTSLPVNYKAIKVRILNISWREISQDLNISTSVSHSRLFNLIANKEFNTLGGEPYGLVVIDHNLTLDFDYDNEFDDLYTLELLAALGEKSLCPILLDADDGFLGAQGEQYLADVEKVKRVLTDHDFDTWHRLRESPNSHFLGLVFNKVAIRESYEYYPAGFVFNEDETEAFKWGNAATTFLKNVIIEFNRVRWFGFLKSRKLDSLGGSAIKNYGLKANLEPRFKIHLSASSAAFLSQLGLIPIFYNPLNNRYFFQSNSSVKLEQDGENRFLIQTTLMISRIAHYIKLQLRQMIGAAMEPHDCENRISHWLEQYCSNSIVNDEVTLAGMPLRSAKVTVDEEPGSLKRYSCQIDLMPQYQYDRVASLVSLSTAVE
ncbi:MULTISPECIES: type VI secretion system contractile sheath domain-containing protein [Pseudoalteromonas]|uniref:type VI secretion system contractile sheath domain-containing protein n=1 Tax=Pseudoalteromonas TaxID=53246 RepID=UPI00026C90CE|nr:type VI secretion system contractile sheath large subunit [Pseudoalteromonas spongiae]ATC98167.1 type VI secretion system protein ImpD [Pseudoalteromonas spongiae UST010723-006]